MVRVKRYEWLPVVRRLRCKPSVKLVAFVAASYGNTDGGSIFPGIVRLANVTGLDDRTIKIALAELRKLRLMARVFEGSACGRRGGMADEHVLTLPDDPSDLPLLPADESDPERDEKREAARRSDARRKRRRKEQVISDPEQVISVTGTGDLSSRIPVSEITPPVHGPVHVSVDEDHHSARSEPRHAQARDASTSTFAEFAAEQRKALVADGEVLSDEDEEYVADAINRGYVDHVVTDLDVHEDSTVDGMLGSGAHPKTIVNTIMKGRGEGEADYRDAQSYLLSLPDEVRQTFETAAESHMAAHFPDASRRYRVIYAARLAQRAQVAT